MAKTSLNGNAKWIAVIVGLLLAAGGWVWNAAIMCEKVETNTRDDAKVHPQVRENHDDILELKKDVSYIRNGVDEIRAELKK